MAQSSHEESMGSVNRWQGSSSELLGGVYRRRQAGRLVRSFTPTADSGTHDDNGAAGGPGIFRLTGNLSTFRRTVGQAMVGGLGYCFPRIDVATAK